MAKAARRERKVKVIVIHKHKGKLIRAVVLPPGSSTGRHRESKSYYLHSLTGGTLHVEVYRKVRGKEQKTVEVRKLKRLEGYQRNVGRGVEINLKNKSRSYHVITKG
ncbi:MAG TPA: hypothetical protein VKY65_07015 [Alphaproteobacteria bacterium]|nr:hypothetical protein [Alphaproteobacteria bacterium]